MLCVGAGGIGCELLKTLVLTGFEDIELVRQIHLVPMIFRQDKLQVQQSDFAGRLQIDMDTIDTSNLNRQFLFRRKHVGQSKAKVAAESVLRFRPNAHILAHQVCSAAQLLALTDPRPVLPLSGCLHVQRRSLLAGAGQR